MTINQPSPDRLIFQPKYKSIISFQITSGIFIICCLSIAGASIFAGGLLFSFILSKSLAGSYLNISNDPFRVSMIILISIFIVLFGSFWLYLARLLLRHHITDSCTFDYRPYATPEGITSAANDWYFGDVLIQQRNIFNQQRTLKIPLHTITNIRLQYISWLYPSSFNILLDTTISAEPIYISKLIQNVKPVITFKSIRTIVPSLSEEIESIRDFLQLPPKPSYLVDKSSDYLSPSLLNFHKPKILKETATTFSYRRRYRLPWYRETFTIHSDLGIITIEYQYFTKKFVRQIAIDTIKSVTIKRELSAPMDSIFEIFNCSATEKYSVILVSTDSSLKRSQGYGGFYLPGNVLNSYGRVYTSKDLSDIEDFVDRLNHYLKLADRASSLQSTY